LPRQLFFFGILGAAIIQGRKLFKGGNYSREETINFFLLIIHNLNFCCMVIMLKWKKSILVSGKLD
jgi:hypothetical protein